MKVETEDQEGDDGFDTGIKDEPEDTSYHDIDSLVPKPSYREALGATVKSKNHRPKKNVARKKKGIKRSRDSNSSETTKLKLTEKIWQTSKESELKKEQNTSSLSVLSQAMDVHFNPLKDANDLDQVQSSAENSKRNIPSVPCSTAAMNVTKHTLRKHSLLEKDKRTYICGFDKCCFTSKFKGSLTRHVMRVHDSSSVKCKCGMVFSAQTGLDVHMRRAHSTPETCAICGKIFTLKAQLRHHHVNHHTSQRRFRCHLCDKQFNNKVTYEGHVDSHSSIKRHKCSKCPRMFTYRSSLTKHIPLCKAENEVCSYVCEICGREFKIKSYLTAHMNGMHRSANHFRCVCGQAFSWSGSLSNHRKTCRFHSLQLLS